MDDSISPLELASVLLVKTFEEYASRGGNSDKMSRCEAKTLLKETCPHMLAGAEQMEGGFDGLFDCFDRDKSGDICFPEFAAIFCGFSFALREQLKQCERDQQQHKCN